MAERAQLPTKQPPATQAPGTTSAGATNRVADQGPGNAALAEQARSADGTAAGMATYQASLGAWLGGELYGAVAKHLTQEKIEGYARKALEAGGGALTGALEKTSAEVDTDATDAFSEELGSYAGDLAAEWLATEDGAALVKSLGSWVDASPEAIATVAILAAAGAVVADMKIPELQHTFKLGEGVSAQLGAKLGSLRHVALEQVGAQLDVTSGPLIAAVKVTSDPKGKVSGTLHGELRDEARALTVDGTLTDNKLELYEVSAFTELDSGGKLSGSVGGTADKAPTITAALETTDGKRSRTRNVEYDGDGRVLTFNDIDKLGLDNGGELTRTFQLGSDGASKAALGWAGGMGVKGLIGHAGYEETTAAGSAGDHSDPTQSGTAGVEYTKDSLKAQLDMALSSTGARSVSGSVESDLGTSWHGTAAASHSRDSDGAETSELSAAATRTFSPETSMTVDGKYTLGDNSLYEVGAAYGFRSETEFEAFLAEYRYNSEDDSHTVDLMIEHTLGALKTRLKSHATLDQAGLRHETSLQGAWSVNPDVSLIGGLAYQVDDGGRDKWMPQAGVQIHDVPVVVTYDPSTKGVMIGVTLSFGR